MIDTLILTAHLNDGDSRAWHADVLTRIADHPANRLDDLLPWTWQPKRHVRYGLHRTDTPRVG